MTHLEQFIKMLESCNATFESQLHVKELDNRSYITVNPNTSNIVIVCFDSNDNLFYMN